MTTQLVIQTFINGIQVGALYGLAAVGLSLIFGVMRILNVAHGEFIMIGGYIGFWLFTWYRIDPFQGLPLVAAALFLLGLISYKLLFAGVARLTEEVKLKNSLLVAFGIFLIFPQVARMLWTADERAITPIYSGGAFEVIGLRFAYVPLWGLLVASGIILALSLLLHKTFFGKAIRGISANWKAAKIMGINVDQTYMITFALGVAIAGVAGVLIGLTQAITPMMGMGWTLKALVVVVLAGIGSIGGAFFAGLILGVVEAIGAIFMGSYTVALGLVIFLFILMFRPQGLFGKA